MAQLPPKAPTSTTMPPIWSNLTQQLPANSMATFLPATTNPAWLTDFHDFSSTKRCSHRRSVSDSIAFLEAPNMSDDSGRVHDFDGLDYDQLIYMFSDEVAPPSPSDHNSINDEKPGPSSDQQAINESEDAQSERKTEQQIPAARPDTVVFDPKRVKRILANRQSAQRSRVRKLQYISELERSVTTLQTQVSSLSPRVAFLDHQCSILTVGNSHLQQRIAALAQDNIFKDAHQEALKKEIERLRHVYRHQNLQKMVAPASDRAVCNDKELLT